MVTLSDTLCRCDDVKCLWCIFFFKQKTAYEMRISDWSSDVCSSDLVPVSVPGVDSKILDPRQTWANGAEYDAAALKLIGLFADNFEQFAEQDRKSVV